MIRIAILLMFISAASYGQLIVNASPPGPWAAGYIDFVAWYDWNDDLTDEGGNFNGTTMDSHSFYNDTTLLFDEADDGDDGIYFGAWFGSSVGDFTVSYMINLADGVGNDNDFTFGQCWPYNGSYTGIFEYYDPTTTGYFNWLGVRQLNGSTSYATTVSGGNCVSTMADDTWYHVVVVWRDLNSTPGYATIYIDGTKCGGDTTIASYPIGSTWSGENWVIGNAHTSYTSGMNDGDMIDNVMIFDGDLREDTDAWDQLMANPYDMPTQ